MIAVVQALCRRDAVLAKPASRSFSVGAAHDALFRGSGSARGVWRAVALLTLPPPEGTGLGDDLPLPATWSWQLPGDLLVEIGDGGMEVLFEAPYP